jgi:uncharacterized protein YbjT (DUF2867 family)
MTKIAVLVGASGLIGTELLQQLLEDPDFEKVKIVVRKLIQLKHPKLEQVVINFDEMDKYSESIKGDIGFCTLGTTIKTAGSKEAFSKVDHGYVTHFAEIIKRNGAFRFVVVSSLGVTENGGNFYLTVKRDMENSLKKLKFKSLIILRPSMLLGNRKEFRFGENIGKILMKVLGFLLIGKLKKYKAIQANTVAKAMLKLSKTDLENVSVFESDRLKEIGKS